MARWYRTWSKSGVSLQRRSSRELVSGLFLPKLGNWCVRAHQTALCVSFINETRFPSLSLGGGSQAWWQLVALSRASQKKNPRDHLFKRERGVALRTSKSWVNRELKISQMVCWWMRAAVRGDAYVCWTLVWLPRLNSRGLRTPPATFAYDVKLRHRSSRIKKVSCLCSDSQPWHDSVLCN